MDETVDGRVARLQAELAKAKLEQAAGSSSSSDTRLCDPPRRVPLAMRLLVLTWSWWAIWALFMVAIAPISVWQSLHDRGRDVLELVLMEGVLVAVLLFLMRKTWLRQTLLRRGVVARVTDREVTSVGTYYSGLTYQNSFLAQAERWKVTRRLYSGPSTKTQISYDVGGTREQLTLRGLPYKNGVILADPRKPSRALCVSQFPYDLDRDDNGDWIGRLSLRVVIGSVAMWAVAAAWTIQALRIYHGAGLH